MARAEAAAPGVDALRGRRPIFSDTNCARPGSMPTFSSSAVTRAEYDPETRVLRIWFTGSEGRYDYADVPPQVFEELCRAPSKGRYVNEEIRDLYATERHASAPARTDEASRGPASPSLLDQLRGSITVPVPRQRSGSRKPPDSRRPRRPRR
ncbi:hypothetical protein GCM10010994_39560 [Chelatococcus reniformis]|uniref:KTSC domain-containing protein n=2 Tax=Chelatococcus reniformis TaxID=1494448 RepID=A0A916UMC4_9HYPH|nr:hypothetical protein GCM10010994_39560 [Chelatococcus reniformis]